MKLIKITSKTGQYMESPQADAESGLALILSDGSWGKPERWVLHKDEQLAEAYDEADVLEERIVDGLDGASHKEVKLKAEYLVEILNLEEDSDWLLQQCHAKRMVEYPSLGEFADAYVKLQSGDSSQMEAYVAKCIEVKQKYPKP